MKTGPFKKGLVRSLLCCAVAGAGWFFVPSVALGDIYRYVDPNGVIHFTNIPSGKPYTLYLKEKPKATLKKKGKPRDIGKIYELVRRYAGLFSLEEELVNAVIKVESDYDPSAVSSKGAQGLMQLIPETARDMEVENPFDMEENIRGGSRYLRLMLDMFAGNLDLALAAYNAGPSAVQRYGGVPPFGETLRYVEKVKEQLFSLRERKAQTL